MCGIASDNDDKLNEAKQKNRLAMRLEKGLGIPVDEERAQQLFREAAEAGDPFAQNNLGYRLARGYCGFEKNGAEAEKWYKKAADQDTEKKVSASAMHNLAMLYRTGDVLTGFVADPIKASEWMKKAAEAGHEIAIGYIDSQSTEEIAKDKFEEDKLEEDKLEEDKQLNSQRLFSMGQMYMHGQKNYPKNESSAANYFKQAANLGHPNAAFELGQCYRFGRGVTRNIANARHWLTIAKAKDVQHAAESLAKISPNDTVSQQVLDKSLDPGTILEEQDFSKRKDDWEKLVGTFQSESSSESSTVKDGGLAFHIGALALAGCSNSHGEPDLFNALYWFKESKKLEYLWGALGLALIDQSEDRKGVADVLLFELDKKYQADIDILDRYGDKFACHVEKYFGNQPFVRVLLAFFKRKSDRKKALILLEDEAKTDEKPSQKEIEKPLNEDESSCLLAWVLLIKIKMENNRMSQEEIERLETEAKMVIQFINGLRKPDSFSRNLLSSANGCLADIRARLADSVAQETEQRIVALQSHTMKNPLSNAQSILKDIRRWVGSKPEFVPIGLTALESTLALVINMIDARDLLLDSDEDFLTDWNEDSEKKISLAQVISEAVQQAVIRLTAKEFPLANIPRKLELAAVNKSSIDILSLDLSGMENRLSLKSGFPFPFNYIKLEIDEHSNHYFGVNGIRRRFFFALVHELAFNAIKYEAGLSNIEITVRNENKQLLISIKNSYLAKAGKAFKSSARGQDFLFQMTGKISIKGAKLEINQSNEDYIARFSIPEDLLSNDNYMRE